MWIVIAILRVACFLYSSSWSIEHHKNHIRFTITGYDLLQEQIFFAWSTVPDCDIAVEIEDDPHPPHSRLDPTMTFSFYGHSVRVPHLRVSLHGIGINGMMSFAAMKV
jgi:hypothetical protein